MKKLMMAVGIMVMVVGVNSASAEMVDIGLGRMAQSEFLVLKALVQGKHMATVPAMSTPIARPERYGMVEMTRADADALRDMMADRSGSVEARPVAQAVQMVNIGTGEMPVDEFIALKRMVKVTGGFQWDHLATAHP